MSGEKAVGIDLGTTNSAMACLDESGRSAMIRNAEGELITPSIVLLRRQRGGRGQERRTAVTTASRPGGRNGSSATWAPPSTATPSTANICRRR